MTKTAKTLQAISFILIGVVVALLIILLLRAVQDSREANKRLDNAEARITSLEQDLQNTKEVLDAKGIEDLNL